LKRNILTSPQNSCPPESTLKSVTDYPTVAVHINWLSMSELLQSDLMCFIFEETRSHTDHGNVNVKYRKCLLLSFSVELLCLNCNYSILANVASFLTVMEIFMQDAMLLFTKWWESPNMCASHLIMYTDWNIEHWIVYSATWLIRHSTLPPTCSEKARRIRYFLSRP